MSYDPDLYSNTDSESFDLSTLVVSTDYEATFRRCIELTSKLAQFEEGQRNNFVFRLACNCKRLGIPADNALELILADYGYDEKEVTASVKSAYANNPDEYAKFANSTNPEAVEQQEANNGELAGTPLIPDTVYAELPSVLKDGASVFDDKRQRDVFLTGALAVVGGCLDNVSGVYHEEETYPNLYAFVIAPAASGKGSLKYSKVLGMGIHAKLQKGGTNPPKVLFIPGNSSASAVLKHLKESDDKGIMFESEADTLNNSLKQEWGNFSDMLRKAFHHEPISSSRTTKDEHIEVPQPRLSIALSGTPNQLNGLIPSAEDGLFSRFLYYAFQGEVEWKDARPKQSTNYTQYFKALSDRMIDLVEHLKNHPTKFVLTDAQWDEHERLFADKLTYRIAMILTALDKAETKSTDEEVGCSDQHFKATLEMVGTYFDHAIVIFKRMPRTVKADPGKQRFFNQLPSGEFTRAKGIEIGKSVGLGERTVDKYLREFADSKLLAKDNYGKYRKA